MIKGFQGLKRSDHFFARREIGFGRLLPDLNCQRIVWIPGHSLLLLVNRYAHTQSNRCMKLCLPSIAVVLGTCLGAWAQMTPDKSWPFGPYDKVVPQKPRGIVFTAPLAPPPLRGAMVPLNLATNSPLAPGIKQGR
jgi:hypothetical protein